MGELVRISDYLERKATGNNPSALTKRLADIAFEMLVLQSEKNRLERILERSSDNL